MILYVAYLNCSKTPRGRRDCGDRVCGAPASIARWWNRHLREEGVPQDLIYLAQAESAFLPQAVSKAGARGMWQFMSFAWTKIRAGKDLVDRVNGRIRRRQVLTPLRGEPA